MSASYRKIDYSLRPAKHAERKMLVDILRRLAPFQPVETYRYVGFGSVWFSDFSLFHKALGIREMVSIEQAGTARARFEANKPFNIDIKYDKASNVLPRLDWSKRNIVWLDYDTALTKEILDDARAVTNRIISGSVLAISVQCTKAPEMVEAERDPSISAVNRLRQNFGRERINPEIDETNLTSWNYGKLIRDLISAEIEQSLSVRNMESTNKVEFTKIADIDYQDDAKMTTIVGIIVSESEKETLTTCAFDKLEFIPENTKRVLIDSPKLTIRELRHIEQQLPAQELSEISLGAIPETDAQKFIKLYRFLPNFAVLEA